jgi:CRISPR-associated endoribonuclease Cas6
MSLLSIVLTLHAEQVVIVPANLGRATHAWFLGQVQAHDAALAASLHEANQERPFTVSNLWGMHRANRRAAGGQRGPAGAEEVTLTPQQPCYLRLSSLQPELTQVLTERLLPALPETITLAGATLRVASVASTADEHPWAGRASYPALVQEHTLGQAPAPGLALRFGSPTVFKSQEQFVPLPLPKLVFESLARRWNAFAPLNLPEEVSRFAGETMAISRYQLRTERMVFGADADRRALPGFVGTVGYSFRNKDRYWMGLIHLLAAFALYGGVGLQVAMGLGQAKRL